jgi:hypothetical protein
VVFPDYEQKIVVRKTGSAREKLRKASKSIQIIHAGWNDEHQVNRMPNTGKLNLLKRAWFDAFLADCT